MSVSVICLSHEDGALGRDVGQCVADALGFRYADEEIVESDKGRAAYLQRFYGVKTEIPSDYDLVLNTDRLLPEAAAAVIIDVASALSAPPD